MKQLLETTGEYGWSHEGHDSWGGGWPTAAVSDALEKIRITIASMVNLKELETFTNTDLKERLDAENAFTVGKGTVSGSTKIGVSQDKSAEERSRWVNENNLLIDVSDVRIKPGTDWSDNEKDWKGVRTWKAKATMLYTIKIYGPD